ncbi:hypothetical protein CDD83_6688 [Cordyceps sp. RAO-2017]|nr:hypothetical protein CDD83_6688 [Cordyceps sp. RAO-2017]
MSIPLLSLRDGLSRRSPDWLRSMPLRPMPTTTKPVTRLNACLVALLVFLLPSFVQSWLRPGPPKKRRHLHPTSWLDGLRGVASLIVFIWHITLFHMGGNWFLWPYGIQDQNDQVPSSPIQLPFIRVIFAGTPMVHVFFVVSGYALSLKPLKQIRKHDYEGLQRTLASSIFRRGIRLYLPVAALFTIIAILVGLGGPFAPLPVERTTVDQLLRDWLNAIITIVAIGWDSNNQFVNVPFNPHLWTVPLEFFHSLLLFLVLAGLGRMRVRIRFLLLLGLISFCLRHDRHIAFEFLGGMALAEFGLVQDEGRERATPTPEDGDAEDIELVATKSSSSVISITSCLATLFFLANLVVSLFLMSWPAAAEDQAPIFMTMRLSGGSPRWFAVAAVQLVLAVQQIRILQRVFITPLVQYLGTISFSLYLVHGPVQTVTAPYFMPLLWAAVGGIEAAGVWRRTLVWFFAVIIPLVPVVWIADVFTRTIDANSVAFARWLESQCET